MRTYLAIVTLFVITFTIPISIAYSLDKTVGNRFNGVPITETIFSDISSTSMNSVMLPGDNVTKSGNSLSMSVDYSSYAMVNSSEAENSVLSFAKQFDYIQDENFTVDTTYSRLDIAEWTYRFLGNDLDLYASVNAISSKVTGFHVSWHGPSPYVRNPDTSMMQIEDIEMAALEFLRRNNYTLSEYSYYISPVMVHNIRYLTHSVYSIYFFELLNHTLVDGNVVSIFIDISTDWVVSFNYQWVFINEIPTGGAMDKIEAEANAVAFINDKSENTELFNIRNSVLLFINLATYEAPVYRLCWAVYTDHSEFRVVYIDAINGDTLATERSAMLSRFITNNKADLFLIVAPFLVSTPIALCMYLGFRYRISAKSMPIDIRLKEAKS